MMVKSVLQKIEEEGMDWSEVEFGRGLRQILRKKKTVEGGCGRIFSKLF